MEYLPEFTVRGDIGWATLLELVRFTSARITLSDDSVILKERRHRRSWWV